jgi:luciferase family oxidoreductase group 1
MSYRLSLLDKSPVAKGETAAEALARTVDLAQLAEKLGFHRYWVAEHHGTDELASSAPEILIAHLASRTSRIRLGSGGVMLQHYAPYKVAEVFGTLSLLAPGRIDLGVGKAPGGLPNSTKALKGGRTATQSFADQLVDLTHWLDGTEASVPVKAAPRSLSGPERLLLGASVESAELAAANGWDLVFARHLNPDDALLEATAAAFRAKTGKPLKIAIAALIDGDGDKARAQAAEIRFFKVFIEGAQAVTVGSEEQAAEYARQAGATDYRVEPRAPSVVAGSPADILAELDRLAKRFGTEEFIIDLFNPGNLRFAAVEGLAHARDLAQRPRVAELA